MVPSIILGAALLLLTRIQSGYADGFKFLSIGDWGDDATLVGSGLSKFFDEEADGAPLGLFLGDNFYESGVRSVDDPQWTKKYLEVFKGKNVDKMKFMVTAGNHDYYGNVSAQYDYTKKDPTKRWLFPAPYHTRYFEQNGVSLFVMVIDTWRLNGGDAIVGFDPRTGRKWLRSREALREAVKKGDFSERLGNRLEASLPFEPERPVPVDEEQYEWIKRTLTFKSAVESDWRIVVGHFPIHSASKLEHGDTPSLVKRLDPLLRELNVDAYFAGHDHILQILKRGSGLHYYGSGAGARRHPKVNTAYKGLLGHSTGAFGFMRHKATKNSLTTTFVISDGEGLGSTKSYAFSYVQSKSMPPPIDDNHEEVPTLVAVK